MDKKVRYLLSEDELRKLAEASAKEMMKQYLDEKRKEEGRKKDKVRITKKLLSSYRRAKAAVECETEFTDEEKIELRWKFVEDLMGNAEKLVSDSEMLISNSEQKRKENLYCIHCIETAIRLYREECDKITNEEGKRRFRELYALYIADEPMTVPEIAAAENVSEKTVYKDIGIACKIIAVYLLGMQ